jgi:hypothetical protein
MHFVGNTEALQGIRSLADHRQIRIGAHDNGNFLHAFSSNQQKRAHFARQGEMCPDGRLKTPGLRVVLHSKPSVTGVLMCYGVIVAQFQNIVNLVKGQIIPV